MGPSHAPRQRPAISLSLAHLLERAAGGDFIVTAGRRLARTLHLQFAELRKAQTCAWRTPRILPWPAWIDTLWDAALYDGLALPARLEPDQELLLWERIIAEESANHPLLDSTAAAQSALTSWDLMHAWKLDYRAVAAAATGDTEAFLRWAARFRQHSQDENWLESARRPDCLVPLLDRIPLPPTLILAGFDELTPQQETFLAACEKLGTAIHQAQPARQTPATYCRVALPDRTHELETAARWARALIEDGRARTVGIIVPDLESIRAEAERVFSRVLDPARLLPGPSSPSRAFNIAAPPPLITHPLIRAALLALDLDPERNPFATVSRLLRSSFIMGADAERAPRARLDAYLRDLGIAEISIERLRRFCRRVTPAPKRFRLALRRWAYRYSQFPERRLPSAWAHDFACLLRALGWPGDRTLSSDEYQTLDAWNQALARFARLDRVAAELTRAEALAHLRRILARTPHQPQSEPAPIQILGVLEAAGLEFDALWICGLDEESWPPPPSPDPFLPLALQRAHGLPHSAPERELAFARRLTDRLLASAPLVVASWPRRVEDRDCAPSPLIRDWPEIAVHDLPQTACPGFVQVLLDSASVETREESGGPPLDADVWSRGGSRVFQYQALCPFRAFAALRLGAAPLASPDPGLRPLDRGQAVHGALECFWRRCRNYAALCELDAAELHNLLEEAVQHGLQRLRRSRNDLGPRLLELERQRLKLLLAAWLDYEKNRREPFEVAALEQQRDIELAGVRACLKIDRVDRLADGREIILDYKTGRCSPADWEGHRPEDPQLPLYAVTHQNPLAGVLYARIKTGEIRFTGLYADRPLTRGGDKLTPDRLQNWRRTLEQLAESFCSGHAAVDPKKRERTCRNCRLDPLCRIHEARIQPEEDEEETA